MPGRLMVTLSAEERAVLDQVIRCHRRPYMRERAAAILQVADGGAVRVVARRGILRPRDRDTVSDWVHRYLENGVDGLLMKPGRGRKPAFSPSVPDGGTSG
jgi:hypothetical protein